MYFTAGSLADLRGQWGPWPQTSDYFLFCKTNRFWDKLADSSNCDNVKRRSALGASSPDPLTRGSVSRPPLLVRSLVSPCGPRPDLGPWIRQSVRLTSLMNQAHGRLPHRPDCDSDRRASMISLC